MSILIGKVVSYEGRRFVVIGIRELIEMLEVREVGRNFKTLIPFDYEDRHFPCSWVLN